MDVTQIGKLIHHCRAIELALNEVIRSLSTDQILAEELVRSDLQEKVDVFNKLLKRAQPDLDSELLSNLASDIMRVGEGRNIIANNSLISASNHGKEVIFDNGKGGSCEYGNEEISKILDLSNDVLIRLTSILSIGL